MTKGYLLLLALSALVVTNLAWYGTYNKLKDADAQTINSLRRGLKYWENLSNQAHPTTAVYPDGTIETYDPSGYLVSVQYPKVP